MNLELFDFVEPKTEPGTVYRVIEIIGEEIIARKHPIEWGGNKVKIRAKKDFFNQIRG